MKFFVLNVVPNLNSMFFFFKLYDCLMKIYLYFVNIDPVIIIYAFSKLTCFNVLKSRKIFFFFKALANLLIKSTFSQFKDRRTGDLALFVQKAIFSKIIFFIAIMNVLLFSFLFLLIFNTLDFFYSRF